jgi:WD40 repeat protein
MVGALHSRTARGVAVATAVNDAVAPIADNYDLLLIDCPPGEQQLQQMALTAAEFALIPTKSDSASLDGLVKVAELFGAVRATTNPDLQLLGVVLFGIGVSAKRIAQTARGNDGTVRVWDLTRTAAPRTLHGRHPNGVWAVALSADGRTAISGGPDGTVRVWDLTGTAAPRTLHGHPYGMGAVALSADGRTAISGGGHDRTVRVWRMWESDLTGTAAPRTLHGHPDGVWAVALSAHGRTAISGGDNGTVRVWDLTGTAVPRELHHPGEVWGVALSGDGRTAISAGNNGTVRVPSTP